VLVLVRHGESTANAAGLLLGRTDAQLTAKGRTQAASVRALLHVPVHSLRSSPLARARSTAALLDLDLPTEIDDRWIEVDYGEFEGQPLSDVPGARAWPRSTSASPRHATSSSAPAGRGPGRPMVTWSW